MLVLPTRKPHVQKGAHVSRTRVGRVRTQEVGVNTAVPPGPGLSGHPPLSTRAGRLRARRLMERGAPVIAWGAGQDSLPRGAEDRPEAPSSSVHVSARCSWAGSDAGAMCPGLGWLWRGRLLATRLARLLTAHQDTCHTARGFSAPWTVLAPPGSV